jgi:chromosome segregation ATPase
MNIQIDNPMCFLSQETSKTFLNVANKSTNFELFMKASQLETVRHLLEKCAHEHQISIKMIEEKHELMRQLEAKLFECEEAYKRSIVTESLNGKVNFLRKEHLWACVRDGELALNRAKQKKLTVTKSISVKRKLLETEEEKLSELDLEVKIAEREIDESMGKQTEADALKQSTENCKDLERKMKRLRNEISKLELRLEQKISQKLEFEEKLVEHKDVKREIEEYKLNIKKKEEMIESTQSKMSQTATQISSQEEESAKLRHLSQQMNSKIQMIVKDLMSNEDRIQELEKEIKSLAGGDKSRDLAFGQFMPGLLSDIESCFRNGRFKVRPLGKP